MTTVVVTHEVGDMDTWLAGGDDRKAMFADFCSNYRIFIHTDGSKVSIVAENVDLAKMKTLLGTPEAAAAKAKHTVIEPLEVYIEADGGK